MKKLAAISLLTLFVFNIIGFRILADYAQKQSDIALEAHLDKGQYSDDELIMVKVPVNLPYQNNWNNFERTDGEININGETYKYVKRKVYNDTLILLCIRHYEKTEIQQKANDYFGNVNGLPANNDNNKKAEIFRQLTNDYEINEQAKNLFSQKNNISYNLVADIICSDQYLPCGEQPPDCLL
ncbi:MAG: hypothetical protein ABJA79_09690 [Parafilimonas sp.]